MGDICRTNFGLLYEEDDETDFLTAKIDSNRLFQSYFRRPFKNKDIKMLCDTYELAKKIKLDDEKTWNYLRNSTYVYGQNLAFVEDTIDFIYGGRRNVSIDNWMRLVDVGENKDPVINYKIKYRPMPVVDNKDILMLWIKRDNGLADMIIFLYLILLETHDDDDD